MLSCTFFGHRNSGQEYYEKILSSAEALIVEKGVCNFFVGNNGQFDFYAHKAILRLKEKYDINYSVVVAYLPKKEDFFPYGYYKPEETLYPFGIEKVPKRASIAWRNKWMIDKSEFIISGVKLSFGGAYESVEYAKRKKDKKTIIEI